MVEFNVFKSSRNYFVDSLMRKKCLMSRQNDLHFRTLHREIPDVVQTKKTLARVDTHVMVTEQCFQIGVFNGFRTPVLEEVCFE